LGADSFSSATAGLLERTLKATTAYVIHHGPVPGLVSTHVAALTEGALKAMFWTKLKLFAAVVVTLTVIGTGSSLWAFRPAPDVTMLTAEEKSDQDNASDEQKATPAKDKTSRKKSSNQSRAEEVVSKSFKTGKAPRLIVEMFNGGIEIVAKNEESVEAKVTKKGWGSTDEEAKEQLKEVDVNFSQEGETIHVVARQKEKDRPNVHAGASAEIQVPAGAVLDMRTGNGSVTVTGGNGNKKIHSSNGAIRLKENGGTANLDTSNGAIVVSGGTGQMQLKTSNGRIDVHADKATVTAHSSNGGVRFRGTLVAGDHSFHTSNGGISIVLPAEAQFRVNAKTSLGQISSDFFTVKKTRGSLGQHVETTIGANPSLSISLQTSNGGISIHKAGQEREEKESRSDTEE
jgi:hypothetical protein